MKISVVIPTYNEEQYLENTLRSLQSQIRRPDEVLVVDSASTDQTVRIAKKFGARIVTCPKRGIGLARQTGLLHAKGDIVACTDADTEVPNDWLQTIEETCKKNPELKAVYGNFTISSGAWWYVFFVSYLQGPLLKLTNGVGLPIAAGQNMAFYRNEAMHAGGFPTHFKMVEDNEMIRRLKTRGSVRYLPNLVVKSSGRRGNEGIRLPFRYAVAFFLYFLFRRGDIIGFKDYR